MAGAGIVDSILVNHLIENQEQSSFSERAFCQRVGEIRQTATNYPESPFCPSGNEMTLDVYLAVVMNIPEGLNSFAELNDSVYEILVRDYPCQA